MGKKKIRINLERNRGSFREIHKRIQYKIQQSEILKNMQNKGEITQKKIGYSNIKRIEIKHENGFIEYRYKISWDPTLEPPATVFGQERYLKIAIPEFNNKSIEDIQLQLIAEQKAIDEQNIRISRKSPKKTTK